MLWDYVGVCQRYVEHLSLYPPIPYLHMSEHSFTIISVKMMLFIGTTFDISHWRNLNQSSILFL